MTFKKGESGNPYGRAPKYQLGLDWNRKYSMAKAQARFRNEEWAFDAASWYNVWEISGVKEHQGRQPHQYCMVRKDIIEAWGPTNCIIIQRRMHLKKRAYLAFRGYKDSPWTDKPGGLKDE